MRYHGYTQNPGPLASTHCAKNGIWKTICRDREKKNKQEKNSDRKKGKLWKYVTEGDVIKFSFMFFQT